MYQKVKVSQKNANRGITLVALMITIIVLLILAGVAINLTINQGDLFGKAEEATTGWNQEVSEEKSNIDELLGYLGIEPPTEVTTELPAGWSSDKIKEAVKQGTKTAPVPVGYSVSGVAGENSINSGLVIYEGNEAVTGEANSAEHITAMENRNQYVWIPVDDINRMVMCKRNGVATKVDGTATAEGKTVCELELQGNELVCKTHGYTTATALTADNIDTTGLAGRLYAVNVTLKETTEDNKQIYQAAMNFSTNNQTFTRDMSDREPDVVTYFDQDDATNTYMAQAGITSGLVADLKKQLNDDFIAMAKSVAKYGGFYVGRYEAGANGAAKKNQLVLTAATSAAGNYVAGNMWYGIYNTLRNTTGINTSIVNSHMIWRKPI